MGEKSPDYVKFHDNITREGRRIAASGLRGADIVHRLLEQIAHVGFDLYQGRRQDVPGWIAELLPHIERSEREFQAQVDEAMRRVSRMYPQQKPRLVSVSQLDKP